jgi:uncharacterized phage protein gp47/JayE
MPVPVEKSLDQVRSELIAQVNGQQEAENLPAQLNLFRGPIRGMIELWAWGLSKLYELLISILNQAFPRFSSDNWLNLHCEQINITRKPATQARGKVKFFRAGDLSSNVPIAAGRIVKTKPDGLGKVYRYITSESAVLQKDAESVTVAVIAEDYGQGANAAPGQISEIVTVISGVDGVTNDDDWLVSEGADGERDASLRERYVLAWQALGGLSKYFYHSLARSVPGVIGVAVLDQHPRGQGTVDVVIKGAAGLPTADLLEKVDAVIQAGKPQNDDVLVKAPTPVAVSIAIKLIMLDGNLEEAKNAATNRIAALFASPAMPDITPLAIGDDFVRDRLTGVLMAIPGLKKIVYTSPEDDLTVAPDGLAVLQNINIKVEFAAQA